MVRQHRDLQGFHMLKIAFAALLVLAAGSTAFAKTPQGAYTVSFFSDPGSVAGSQICL
jgi:hypothetical protein